jgi:hypothetical protein
LLPHRQAAERRRPFAVIAQDSAALVWSSQELPHPGEQRLAPLTTLALDLVEQHRADQHLGRMDGWEQIEQQRQAEARQELERRAAERLRDRPAPGEDGPRRSGPRFSGPR